MKTYDLIVLNVTPDSGHVTPSGLPFARNVDLKFSIVKLESYCVAYNL